MRKRLDYSARREWKAPDGYGHRVDEPIEGYYRHRLRSDGVRGAVRIWYGPPLDPVTGEELDRSWRWQATMNGEPIDFDRCWPACASDPLSAEEYNYLIQRNDWAKRHAPESGYADARKKHDLFDINSPLPF